MVTQNSTNLKVTNNADGYDIAGGTTARKLTLSGGDVALAGGGSSTITFRDLAGTVALLSDIGGGGVTYTVSNKTDDYTVQTSDLGYGNTLTMSHATLTKTFTLPELSASELGKEITFVKLGAAKVVIQAATGQYIHTSTSAGTIYDELTNETWATITLRPISTTKWVIVGSVGTWTTT